MQAALLPIAYDPENIPPMPGVGPTVSVKMSAIAERIQNLSQPVRPLKLDRPLNRAERRFVLKGLPRAIRRLNPKVAA